MYIARSPQAQETMDTLRSEQNALYESLAVATDDVEIALLKTNILNKKKEIQAENKLNMEALK